MDKKGGDERERVGKFTFLTLRCEQGGRDERKDEDIETTGETA